MTLKVKELPMYERPYEKLELYGEACLSNSELLAIIIESGTKDETSIQLAHKVISLSNSFIGNELRALQEISLEELKKIKGIGRVKAIRLKAAFELAKNKIVRIIDASFGGTNFAVIEPKEILAEPIKMGADKIILIHNHPSGNATPSQEDFEVTKRIKLCADLFGIKLLDHIVIGDGEFKSAFL